MRVFHRPVVRLVTAASLRTALHRPGTVLLDSAAPDRDSGRTGALLFAEPRHVIAIDSADGVVDALGAIEAAVRDGRWVAGWLAYEAGYGLEDRLRPLAPPTDRVGWLGVFDCPVDLPRATVDVALGARRSVRLAEPSFALTPERYAERMTVVRDHIAAGDVYQANLTAPLRFGLDGDPVALYAALRVRQPAPYAAWIANEDRFILSLSPELFFRLDGRILTARPMKGTAPRGADAASDQRLAAALASDVKNRAENLMIVDLLRNDLARVSIPGSVKVPALFDVEAYPTVWQMTSTVTATLADGRSASDALRALFPCGSVTGAPKIAAMELIRRLEDGPRGVYCGAIGYAGPRGAVFSVPIRTVELAPTGRAWLGRMGLGSGVVWDSKTADEYAECLLKGRFLTGLAVRGTADS